MDQSHLGFRCEPLEPSQMEQRNSLHSLRDALMEESSDGETAMEDDADDLSWLIYATSSAASDDGLALSRCVATPTSPTSILALDLPPDTTTVRHLAGAQPAPQAPSQWQQPQCQWMVSWLHLNAVLQLDGNNALTHSSLKLSS